jgi:hypothetical protein
VSSNTQSSLSGAASEVHVAPSAIPAVEYSPLRGLNHFTTYRAGSSFKVGAMRQISRVHFADLCQAKGTVVYKFFMRFGFPPFEAREKVHHVRVSLQHGHGIIFIPGLKNNPQLIRMHWPDKFPRRQPKKLLKNELWRTCRRSKADLTKNLP